MDPVVLIVMAVGLAALMFFQGRSRRKQQAELVNQVQPGSEVMLGSGIIGTVEALAGDRLMLVTAGKTLIEVDRRAVMRVLTPASEAKAKAIAKTASKKPAAKTKTETKKAK